MVASIYVKAFFISLAIFILGLFTGVNMEQFMTSSLITETKDIETSVQELELEILYFQNLNEPYSCDFLNEIVRTTNNKLDELAGQISSYSEDRILLTKVDVENLKKMYTSLLIKDWLLQERIKKTCGTDVVTVLYFYNRKGCQDCLVQGNILSSLKDSFKEKLMVFPLDVDLNSYMVNILMKRFNITSTPSVVIEDTVYRRIASKSELSSIICSILNEASVCQ